MKAKHVVHILTLLIALGTVAFFGAHSDAQTTEDPWEAWVEEQTETVLKSAGEMDTEQRAEMRTKIREKFSALAADLKNEIASPPQTQDYADLQTVKELRDTYDADYDRKHKDTTVRVSYTIGDTEIFAYDESVPLAEVDAKYPRDAWLQMLLDKGVTIKNENAYWEYLFLRDTLVHLERQPQVWTSGLFEIPATEDWETYKASYIERELDQIQKRLGKTQHARILDRVLEHHHSLLEKDNLPKTVFQDIPPDLFQSLPPDFPKELLQYTVGPQTVKVLRGAYDEKYNERYAITSGSVSYTLNDGTIFEYKVPLPLSEVDAKYPRDEWLQMLVNKGIIIDNFEEYWTYLSKRGELVELEKKPEIWSSRLFGISPTDDWETYKAAYLKQMFEKLGRKRAKITLYGKTVVPDVLRKHVEQLERHQRSLRDR
ncbi:hypothetical protein C6499_18885 [Candidatus Poribacteria bacterium]|nr:MAG: hypothetical protein C6499_18885 [Candidatus Poribacteria bacterium]